LYTQERDLREVFEHYGPVDEVQVVYDHQSGRSRGFAFIYMRNHDDALEVSTLVLLCILFSAVALCGLFSACSLQVKVGDIELVTR